MKNTKVEVEGGEILIQSKEGHYAVIPTKHRQEVMDMVKDNCDGCINSYIEGLPKEADYAEDGSLYSEYLTTDPPAKKHPLDPNPDGSLPSYFEGSEKNPIQLDEVTVTAEAPDWLKYRKEYVANNPFNIDEYVENRYNAPVGREAIKKIDGESWKKELRQEGLEKRYNSAMDYTGEQLVKNKPQGNLSRAEWLNQMNDKEEELIKRNPKYQSSLWADTKRGLTSLVEQNPAQTFQNILSSSDYSTREKREMLKDYADHPIMFKLGDAAKILSPLTVGSKVVQSAYRDDITLSDALKGKKNNAGIVEDILTDPTTYMGLGIAKSVLKGGLKGATKVGGKTLATKVDDIAKPAASSVDDVGKGLTQIPQAPKQPWQMQEMPGLHLKSTMEGQAISKIVEPKTGLVNVEQALGIIGKESGGAEKVAMIRKGLGDKIPQKMDFNEFRKVTQDQLIPLERQFRTGKSDYGIDRIGYKAFGTPDQVLVNGKWTDNVIQDIPLENQTLILGNKSKFGRGSSAHGNPDETLGHAHFLRDTETPDVLTVTQIQSDAFQGTHRIMPNKTGSNPEMEKWKKMLTPESRKEAIEMAGVEAADMIEADALKFLSQAENKAIKALGPNPAQKQLLDKNHQERYLQELVDYAGKRGDVNKVRVPTSETAAKVQGYTPYKKATDPTEIKELEKGIEKTKKLLADNPLPNTKKALEKGLQAEEAMLKGLYSSEHQTILKKYSEQPKTIKKLFGEEPKIVTDSKGNTWYEFDIPDKAKKGKMEIKAFTTTGAAIGTGAALQNNKTKTEE